MGFNNNKVQLVWDKTNKARGKDQNFDLLPSIVQLLKLVMVPGLLLCNYKFLFKKGNPNSLIGAIRASKLVKLKGKKSHEIFISPIS